MLRFTFLMLLALLLFAGASLSVFDQVSPEIANAQVANIPVTARESLDSCGGMIMPVVSDPYEQAVVELTNEIRMDAGLSPLKRVEGLTNSARFHAVDMSVDNYFDHNTFNRQDNRTVQICDTWSRIESFYQNWLALAENIAAGQRVPEAAIDGWMNSPDHRHNILSDNYSEIGVGFFEGEGDYRYYWVQNFGKTDGRFPMVLDGEKARSTDQQVDVYIYGDWVQMRLRSDEGSWSDWLPFQTQFTWTLPETAGVHTVTAELRGVTGVYQTSDTIELAP